MPEAKQTPASVPSSAASLVSSLRTVGFDHRAYRNGASGERLCAEKPAGSSTT